MLLKLRNLLKPSFPQLSKLGLTDTHTPLLFPQILAYYTSLSLPKQSKFIQDLIGTMHEHSWIWQLKIYMILHELLLSTQSESLQQRILHIPFLPSSQPLTTTTLSTQPPSDIKTWIRCTILQQYHRYLSKLCLDLPLLNTPSPQHLANNLKSSPLPSINQSFKALNLMTEIMQAQTNFSKMGRYYPEYLIIFDLFKRYLTDIKQYYERIKCTISWILDNYMLMTNEEITHGFYFLEEALVTSDRQYEFFYNRYFYERMKEFSFPTFYQLDYERHGKMMRYVRKRGLELEYGNREAGRKGRAQSKGKEGETKGKDKGRGLKHRYSMNMNKTLDGNETTAMTIQDHCKTMVTYENGNKYEEDLYNL